MIEREDEAKVAAFEAPPETGGPLPYTIELWDLTRTAPERVIGRAASVVLARAIFAAARTEHLGRRLVLRRGGKVVQESD
jgi:hypothetical protein